MCLKNLKVDIEEEIMKRETIITYDESDYELLRKHLDDAPRPCKSCNMGAACCGCPDAREWDKQHQDIKMQV